MSTQLFISIPASVEPIRARNNYIRLHHNSDDLHVNPDTVQDECYLLLDRPMQAIALTRSSLPFCHLQVSLYTLDRSYRHGHIMLRSLPSARKPTPPLLLQAYRPLQQVMQPCRPTEEPPPPSQAPPSVTTSSKCDSVRPLLFAHISLLISSYFSTFCSVRQPTLSKLSSKRSSSYVAFTPSNISFAIRTASCVNLA